MQQKLTSVSSFVDCNSFVLRLSQQKYTTKEQIWHCTLENIRTGEQARCTSLENLFSRIAENLEDPSMQIVSQSETLTLAGGTS